MARFKVGDKVTIRSWNDMEKEYGTDYGGCIKVPCLFNKEMKKYCGRKMTISSIRPHHLEDRLVYFLEGAEMWRFSEGMFEESKEKKTLIVIYQNGREVVALDKISGKKGVARCNPEDKFNFYVGAELAFHRLKEETSKPEPYNGKVCCIYSSARWFTKGKIYKVVNGYLKDDEGDENSAIFDNFEEINNYYVSSKFIEVIE